MRILLMTTNVGVACDTSSGLTRAGLVVDRVVDDYEALVAVEADVFDAVVLDFDSASPSKSNVVRSARARGCDAPIMALTAEGEPGDRIAWLDCGADDCLSKPFEPEELAARVRALLRRRFGLLSDKIRFGSLEFDFMTKSAHLNGNALPLTKRERSTLEILILHRGQPVHKERIHHNLYGFDQCEVRIEAVELYVARLRKKLRSSGVSIQTVRQFGYQLCAPG